MITKNNQLRVYFVRLGCDKNDVDADIMSGLLLEGGYALTDNPEDADYIIINTCGFINPAKEESIANILEAIEYKQDHPDLKIIVTGCLAERYANDLRLELAEVDAFVGIGSVDDIVKVLQGSKNETKIWRSDGNLSVNFRKRHVNLDQYTAYVKIAEGCDSYCSYCAIPLIRGRYHSRMASDIVAEVRDLVVQGVKEVILVAQNTTAYGSDLPGSVNLVTLVRQLLAIKGVHWYRLLYCYPGYITDDLLQLMASEDRLASYLDIPIQHANQRILKMMKRDAIDKINPEWFAYLRKMVPDLTLRTTVLVGFPGETESEFQDLLAFINHVQFDHLGVFAFSPEEGTLAYQLTDVVEDEVAQERVRIINEEQQFIAHRRRQRFIGQKLFALVEEAVGDGQWQGRGQADAPEIDGYIIMNGEAEIGQVVEVLITDSDMYISQGRIISNETHS